MQKNTDFSSNNLKLFSVSISEGLHIGYDRFPSLLVNMRVHRQVYILLLRAMIVYNTSLAALQSEYERVYYIMLPQHIGNVAFILLKALTVNDVVKLMVFLLLAGHNSQNKIILNDSEIGGMSLFWKVGYEMAMGHDFSYEIDRVLQDDRERAEGRLRKESRKQKKRCRRALDYRAKTMEETLLTTGGNLLLWCLRMIKEGMLQFPSNDRTYSLLLKHLNLCLERVVVEPQLLVEPKVWCDALLIEEYELDDDDEYKRFESPTQVGDEAVHKELGDRMERAATTASSLEAEQDSDAQTRFEAASKSPMIHLSQEVTHLEVGRTKQEGRARFHQIIDFLTASHIHYALTENPTIYTSFIKQFWTTTTASTNVNGEVELTASIDGQAKTITKASLRRHLKLETMVNFFLTQHNRYLSNCSPWGAPSTSPPPITETTPTTEEPAPMPMDHLSKGSITLEAELAQTKQTYGTALTKLIKKGRSLIEELDLDAEISLVLPHDAEIQEKISDDTKVLLEEEKTAELVKEPTELVEDQGSGEKKGTRERVQKRKDKGKAITVEDESVQKKSKKQLEQERLKEYDKVGKKEAVAEVDIAHVIDWNDHFVIRYHALQHRPRSVAEVRKNMIMYLKNQRSYKIKDFKGMSYNDIRPIFEKVWDQVHSFVPMDSEEEVQSLKRAVRFEAKNAKRQKTWKKFRIPDEGINVEVLQTKYPIIRWEVYSEDTMQFWKIIRVGNYTEMYQVFKDMLKNFDRDDLVKLWSLVQERSDSQDFSED
ncbi:hypothetical protein Tco_1408586 [Tanacetum coccineum]